LFEIGAEFMKKSFGNMEFFASETFEYQGVKSGERSTDRKKWQTTYQEKKVVIHQIA